MSKKIFISLLALLMVFAFISGCGGAADNGADTQTPAEGLQAIAKEDIKVGFVYIGPIGDEGYTYAHNQGRLALENTLGVETVYVENVPENADCEKAVRDLIDQGCNVIYTTSFNYMDWTLNVANDFPNLYFGHATGFKMADNMSNYMGRIYEARYLSGIAAGLRTENNKIGYVGAMAIPEVVRGLNAFTLGVRSVNPEATVEVIWINTWLDPSLEKSAAIELLNNGCDVIAQHCDTVGPQVAAQERGAFAVGYNTPSAGAAPKAYLTAPLFNWGAYYIDDVQRIIDGTWEPRSYWEGMSTDMVRLDTLTENCAPGTAEAVEAAKEKILSGELFVFSGPIKDNAGNEKVPEGAKMTDDEMLNFDWLVEGVIGSVQ